MLMFVVYLYFWTPGKAFIHLLFVNYGSLLHLLHGVLFAPLPASSPTHISSMHQRAWLLKIFAIEIFVADTTLSSVRDSMMQLLQGLFFGGNHGVTGGGDSCGKLSTMLWDILRTAPKEPWIGEGLSVRARKMLEALDIESLLGPQVLKRGEGAAQMESNRGDIIIDIESLKDKLLVRYSSAIVAHTDSMEDLKEAGRSALSHAASLNYFSEFSGGLYALLSACQNAIIAAFGKKHDFVVETCGSITKAAMALLSMIQDCTDMMLAISSGPCSQLSHCLAMSLECLVSSLTLLAPNLQSDSGGVFGAIGNPILSKHLDMVWYGRQEAHLRITLYNVLAMYLHMCQRNRALSPEERETTISVIYQKKHVLQPLINDAMLPDITLSRCALMALSSLVAYDLSSGTAELVHSSPLPLRLLQDISSADHKSLQRSMPSSGSNAALYQAKIEFLLNLALAGQGSARVVSVQRMVSLHTISRLSSCKIFDMKPENSGSISSLIQGTGLRRQYLHQFVGPGLRLILVILGTLPQSEVVHEQVHHFIDMHAPMFDRVLKEAGQSSPALGWVPGRMEVEEANLVVQICNVLRSVHFPSQAIKKGIHESILDLTARLCTINNQSDIPLLSGLEAYRMGGVKMDMGAEEAFKAYVHHNCGTAWNEFVTDRISLAFL